MITPILSLNFALVICSYFLGGLSFLLLTQFFIPDKQNVWYKRIHRVINAPYILSYFSHTYILYLWLFAIGDDKYLLRRFHCIQIFSFLLYLASVCFRVGILIMPYFFTPLNIAVLIFIFGLNGLFRISLRLGQFANKLVLIGSTPLDNELFGSATKPPVQTVAEKQKATSYLNNSRRRSPGINNLRQQMPQPTKGIAGQILDSAPLLLQNKVAMATLFVGILGAGVSIGIAIGSNITADQRETRRQNHESQENDKNNKAAADRDEINRQFQKAERIAKEEHAKKMANLEKANAIEIANAQTKNTLAIIEAQNNKSIFGNLFSSSSSSIPPESNMGDANVRDDTLNSIIGHIDVPSTERK